MIKDKLLELLAPPCRQKIPDATMKHCPSPIYIRAIITRARIVNSGLKREEVAEKCGISLSSLNKYTKPFDNIPCPYVTQYTLENLAGINSSERVSIFRLKGSVNNAEVNFFRAFDEFRSSSFHSLTIDVSVLVALTLEEEKHMKLWDKITLEKQEI